MSTIFEQLEDILSRKSGTLLTTADDIQDFQPYIVCRWLSMSCPEIAQMLNDTTNQLYSGIVSKEYWYKILLTIIPKSKYGYIKYIKKIKEIKDIGDEEIISFISRTMNMSQREIKEMAKLEPIDIAQFKDTTLRKK